MESKDTRLLSGRTVRQVLEESGILRDTSEATEFLPPDGLSFLQDVQTWAMKPGEMSESFNRQVAFLGRSEKGLDDGLDHAHALAEAQTMVTKTHFPFNRAATAPLLRSLFLRLMFLFKSFTLHQMNFSAELLEDALKGDAGPFARMVLGYLTLAGIGATALGGTRCGELADHPAEDILAGHGASGGLLNTFVGPPAASLIDALHGQYEQAWREWSDSTIGKRAKGAAESGDVLELLGLAR
ncbi:MAG: hypothetical protein AB1505_07530 [Candidatus Latescibacterota bacterium]